MLRCGHRRLDDHAQLSGRQALLRPAAAQADECVHIADHDHAVLQRQWKLMTHLAPAAAWDALSSSWTQVQQRHTLIARVCEMDHTILL